MRILILTIGLFVFAAIWWWRGMTGPLPLSALRERYSLAGSTFPVLAGIETHVVDAGEGPAIIMLHGNLSSVWLWNDWADQLVAGGYRVLRFDLPPYGLTARAPDGRLGVIATYDVLSELMDRSAIERAVIVTTANGGPPAAWYAHGHPDRVAGLVFINTPFTAPRGGLTDAASFQRWVRDNFYRYIGKPIWATRSYLTEIVRPAQPLPDLFVMHIHDLGRRAEIGGAALNVACIYAQVAWMATLMIRVHHWTPAQTGAVLASFTLLGAPSAATVGWFVSSLSKRGKTDAPLIAMVAHSLALGLAGPCVWLMPEPIYAAPFYGVMLLVSNWTSSSALMGLAQITPNELRGQITAIHSFATGLVSLTLGSYSVGFLSDHVYDGPTSLAPGLATAFATFGLSAFAVLMFGRAAYRAAIKRAGSWRGPS